MIDGNLDCTGSDFTGGDVSVVEATIGGDALFHQDFTTAGVIDFRLAKVGHSLSFNHARFIGRGDNGLNAERAVVDGPLYWVAIDLGPNTELDLQNARVSALWDDRASWPAPGNLNIDGLTYGEFGGDSPADAAERLQWLGLQGRGYHPQPFAELARALKDSGRTEGETQVLIAQRVAQREYGGLSFAARAWNLLLEATIGYGYRPLRALWWMLGFVLVGTALFEWGYRAGVMAPSEADAYESFSKTGVPPPHYPRFNAFVYSLENFLPVVDLHQGNHWRPNPQRTVRVDPVSGETSPVNAMRSGAMLRWYLWFHIVAGWVLTPLMFAGLSGLIRVD